MYILKSLRDESPKDKPAYEYRVQIIHAIGNIFKDMRYLFNAFENAEVYTSQDLAENAAIELDNQHFTEYDVLLISNFSHYTWNRIKELSTVELENVA